MLSDNNWTFGTHHGATVFRPAAGLVSQAVADTSSPFRRSHEKLVGDVLLKLFRQQGEHIYRWYFLD